MKTYVTPDDIQQALCSLSNMDKKSDNFLVTYYNLPENIANLLTRQTKDFARPDLMFEFSETNHRRNVYKKQAFMRFDPVTITLADDENSITSMIINAQIMRQMNKHKDHFGVMDETKRRNFKFDVKLELFNSRDQVVEGYLFQKCFINNLSYTQPSVATSEDSDIIITLQYDNISILLFDEYMQVM